MLMMRHRVDGLAGGDGEVEVGEHVPLRRPPRTVGKVHVFELRPVKVTEKNLF